MHKVLIIGGAGYIGSYLCEHLVNSNYKVACVDNYIYKNSFSIKKLENNINFNIIINDFRNISDYSKIIMEYDNIIFLAGLVGDPITKKYPDLSNNINSTGIINFINYINKLEKKFKFIFVSTCSNYGIINDDILADENYPLDPISLYAKSKVEIEKYLLDKNINFNFDKTILRFSTAFGLSPRMRYDLTVNEFTQTLINREELIVYDADTWRPYCHVVDFANVIEKIINTESKIVNGEVFNIGSNFNNFSKKQIVETILEFLPHGKVKFIDKGKDMRNYKVNFTKLKKVLNFVPKISVRDGIEEIINYNKGSYINLNEQLLGNYVVNQISR